MRFDVNSTSSVFSLVTLMFFAVITVLTGLNIRLIFHKKQQEVIKDMQKQVKDGNCTQQKVDEETKLEEQYDAQRVRLIRQWAFCNSAVVIFGSSILDRYEDTGEIPLLPSLPWVVASISVLAWIGNRTYRHYNGEFLSG